MKLDESDEFELLNFVIDLDLHNGHSKTMKQTISATAFARMINKSPTTITNWINKGLIPSARKVGGHFNIPIEEVEKARRLSVYPPPLEDEGTEN